ncbi:hypothetical protein [Aquimarina sp. 2201CG14-23]|uniref:hypothetical protein n=1 Tax=Aquimarina mycalae TaxID=3040073 RepID=UPI0024781001|nr:hypothetical protein [Aquimarina sp. 2201CG14-23]MDH7447652.1 hypothetical protein [Aquimarina sp. 2201CG14-23]
MIIDFSCVSIEKVSQQLFLLEDAPVKPMVAASRFPVNNSEGNFKYAVYQIDVAVYLPQGITNLGLKTWKNNNGAYISSCKPKKLKKAFTSATRQITLEFDGVDLNALIAQRSVMFDLYVMHFRYTTDMDLENEAEAIWVNYTYDDPETTRGTVTTVRDIKEKKT